ncbi:MAG TPA: hypothetical protein VGG39_08745 [Polyangiaceae bacterium]|jgi:hypothetical protein
MALWRPAGLIGVVFLGCGSRTEPSFGEQELDAGERLLEAGPVLEAQAEAAPSLCSSYTSLIACMADDGCEGCRCGPCFDGTPDGGRCGPATIFVCLGPGEDKVGDCWAYCPDGSTP